MKIAQFILAGTASLTILGSGALAQEALTGTISKLDEANGKITIQRAQSGTVGTSTTAAADEYKVQDGLLFNALQPGDKVTFSVSDMKGAKTITNLKKQ